MSQVVHTICMQTSDAIKKGEGEFVMQLSGDNPRLNAVKLALGSLELPIVQWTIEDDWSLMYFSEGYRLSASSSWLRIKERSDDQENTIQVHIPLHVNKIQSIKSMSSGYFVVKTEFPHGLYVGGKRCIASAVNWGDIEIICSSLGKVNITKMNEYKHMDYLSETEFMVKGENDFLDEGDFGYLYMPTIPSPQALCDVLTFALQYSKSLGSYYLSYDACENRMLLSSSRYPENSDTLFYKLYGCELAQLLGYPSDEHFRTFYRKKSGDDDLDLTRVRFDFQSNQTEPPLQLHSETFPGWICVKLTPGWYAPAHRPMCTGAPLRITNEVENAFNKLYFSIPERIPKGHATSHFLVFSDPSGSQHLCPIYAGKYTPETICAHLEDEMTRLASKSVSKTYFSVTYDYITHKFTFSCEMKQGNVVVPAQFCILFNHPASIDSQKFGFQATCLKGSDTYTSTEVHIPYMKWSNRCHSNTYRISEIGHQKCFMMESTPLSHMTGLIMGYDSNSSELVIMTYAGQLPYVNGLQAGDVVTLLPTTNAELFVYDNDRDMWGTRECKACPLAFTIGKNGIVSEFGSMKQTAKKQSFVATYIKVKVKSSVNLESVIGCLVAIAVENEPFNLCFGNLPRSVTPKLFGFGKGAIQWGLDGSLTSGNLNIPPFIAKGVHSLDHPDYVLLYIEEGKKNVSLQHRHENSTTSPFAKLVLYPMFREERMLPRDTTLLGSEYLSTFTLRFRNPDGTPYHFHNVDFSFSLNFIRQGPQEH